MSSENPAVLARQAELYRAHSKAELQEIAKTCGRPDWNVYLNLGSRGTKDELAFYVARYQLTGS